MADTWKSPANIISIAGLIISIVINIYQYISNEDKISFEREKSQKELSLAKQKWEMESDLLIDELVD